jgi:hypothetical protein
MGGQDMDLNHRQRAWIMIGLVMIGFIGVLFFDPVPQDPNYHLFADNRTILGIPNFYNVASNVFFCASRRPWWLGTDPVERS